MHDLEDRVRRWTDTASRGAAPVSVHEVWARSTNRRAGRVKTPPRVLLVAAAVLLPGLVIAALALTRDGGGDNGVVSTSGPADPEAEVRPDLMRVKPNRAAPGQRVSLFFPEETSRGAAFVLELRTGDTWDFRYHLSAGGGWAAAGDDFAVGDVGVLGPGPDVLVIPDTAAAGPYRICTANAHPRQFCAELHVQ